MTRFTRRVVAALSILGGLVGAASPAWADPSDPGATTAATTPTTTAAAPTPAPAAPPSAAPSASAPVRTGRTSDVTAPAGLGAVDPAGAVAVRTGLAPTGGPAVPGGAPAPAASAGAPTRSGSRSGRAPAGPTRRTTTAGGSAAPPTAAPTPAKATAPAPPAAAVTASATTYVVVPGDSLWSVAAGRVAAVKGQPSGSVPEATIAAYWRQVCAVNASRLRSGDLNLIFAGELLDLPPVSP